MNSLTANELKIKGISLVESRLSVNEEVVISVRGQDKYVVMDIAKYTQLREYELAMAVQEAQADLAAGRYQTGTVDDYVKQVTSDL